MQTILGANGVIAQELSKSLLGYTTDIRQVSRNPKKINATDQLMSADLLNYDQTEKAVAGSEVVYLLAGLKYDKNVWREQWPKLMNNVIEACKKHNAKLVFFDNVYSYGKVKGPMTEDTPYKPTSKKGEVRAAIAMTLLNEIKSGNLTGMIVRGADFYGPNSLLSIPHQLIFQKMKDGSSPQWMGNQYKVHTFTYTPDAGKCVAILGNTPSAYNQTWHALTTKEKLNGRDFTKLAAEINGTRFRQQALGTMGVRMASLFMPVLREFVEMMYQYDNDYIFDSTKFEKAFNMQATPYREGIAESLKSY